MLYSSLLAGRGVAHGFIPAGQPLHLFGQADGLGWDNMVSPKQVHGDRVVHHRQLDGQPADGIWSEAGDPAPVLGIRTADCVPVLLANDRGDVAAIHSGWRGTVANIVDQFIQEQQRRGIKASSWACALGPSADGCCYEVGPEVFEGLGLRPRRGRIDLREWISERLQALGVLEIDRVGPCTICGDALWASYRRQGADAGRNFALIRAGEATAKDLIP